MVTIILIDKKNTCLIINTQVYNLIEAYNQTMKLDKVKEFNPVFWYPIRNEIATKGSL